MEINLAYIENDDVIRGSFSTASPPSINDKGTSTDNIYLIYNVEENEKYKIYSFGNQWITNILCFDDSNKFINGSNVAGTPDGQDYTIPQGGKKLYIYSPLQQIESVRVYKYNEQQIKTQWYNKNITFFGTSIPAGFGGGLSAQNDNSYPKIVGKYLYANVSNEAVGSSCVCCRKESLVTDSNPYGFMDDFEHVSRCLTNTVEQMQWVIDNYNSGIFKNAPSSLSDNQKNEILSYSYENRVKKYVDGTKKCDLIVIEHGHNDMDSDNFTTDLTGENGMFSYSGCMNFLIKYILSFNPKIRIVILSHYDSQLHTGAKNIIKAQKNVADYWEIPFLNLAEKCGLSQRTISTKGYWEKINNESWWWHDDGGTVQNIKMLDLYIPDGVHPHTDKTGKANRLIAKQVVELLKDVSN